MSLSYADMKSGQRMHFSNGHGSDNAGVSLYGDVYIMEHLATFSVGPEYGLVSPKDGLRRLLQMEKTNGIWTQKMQVKLEKDWVIILDYEDGTVVERFPMNLISDPTAYTTEDSRELYNNILVFIVREDPKRNPNPSEMHIFQCKSVYAHEVVDEMKMLMTGKNMAKYNESRHLPPPPQNPPPEPPTNGNSSKVKEHVAMFSGSGVSSSSARPQLSQGRITNSQQQVDRSTTYVRESNDETSSTTSEKYEREVTILNHCFDDIERFVVRLQHAAAAYKELERRQKTRKSKKKDMGDGMLSIRAKPPPEREFIDILQKFKLSFNLLAKLKSHIHDPNAPELVHFLFTPLALIVDATRDANHSANVAARVVSPLLTRDAIDLLTNCCTSKETDLWHSLGDPWIISRDHWKGYESSYHPIFSNGWAPENPIADNSPISHRLHRTEPELREQDYQRVFDHLERDSHCGSECFSSERGEDHDCSEPQATIQEHSRFQQPYDQQHNHRPANLRRELLERNSILPEPDLQALQDRDLRSEFSSDSIERGDLSLNPQKQFDRQQMHWLEELKSRRAKIVQVVYPRTANNDKELTVIRGEILEVLDDSRKWWKARNMRGQVAHVPHTIVSPYPPAEDDVFSNPIYATRSSRESFYSSGNAGVRDNYMDEGVRPQDSTRSPPMNAQAAPADWVRRERQGKKDQNIPSCEVAPSCDEKTPVYAKAIKKFATTREQVSSHDQNENHEASPRKDLDRFGDVQDDLSKGSDFESKSASATNQPGIRAVFRILPYQARSNEPATVNLQPNEVGDEQNSRDRLRNPSCHSFGEQKIQSEETTRKDLQRELRETMTSTPIKIWKKIGCLEHMKSDCFYLTEKSSKEDVAHWLKIKSFSQ